MIREVIKLSFIQKAVNQKKQGDLALGANCAVCNNGCCGTNNGQREELDQILEKHSDDCSASRSRPGV